MSRISNFFAVIACFPGLLLAGCASVEQPTADEPRVRVAAGDRGAGVAEASEANEAIAAQPAAPSEAPPKVERVEVPIPEASVLPLLEAEFSLRAGRFGRALEILSEQSQLLTDPELARRTLRLAEFLRDENRALTAAIRLATLDPQDGAAAATAMSRLARQGRMTEALVYARAAKSLGSRINAPLLVSDFQRLDASERQAVADGIAKLAAEWPEDQDIAIALALLEREMLNPAGALEVVSGILASDPGEERALVLWTQIQIDLEDPKPYQRIADAVAARPDEERLRLQYARLLASNEQFDEAKLQFDALINQSPRNDEYLMASAMIDLELQAYESAASALQTLIDLGQRVDEANYYLGRTHEAANDPESAVTAYGEVGPAREFPDAKRRAGLLLLSMESTQSVTAFFNEQRWRFPEEARRLFLMEASLLRDVAPEEALEVYNIALEQFPDAMTLRYGRAMLHEAAGDIPAMERDLRAILANDPNNATTLNALGYSLTNHTERYDEAASLIERALELSPREPAMLDSLGWVYFKMGKLLEAEALLREAYQLLPDPEVAAHLGETLWALGKHLEAQDIWRAALERDKDNPHVRAAIDRLGVALDL